eukprot:1377166-Amphidinium_carterae.1
MTATTRMDGKSQGLERGIKLNMTLCAKVPKLAQECIMHLSQMTERFKSGQRSMLSSPCMATLSCSLAL